jgi:ABC-type antimicrobial peptide transport system permease subunit
MQHVDGKLRLAVSWTVTQQRHEIGIRMALGASAGKVRSMVLTSTLRFVLMGGAAGIVLAWGVGRVLASQLQDLAFLNTSCAVQGPGRCFLKLEGGPKLGPASRREARMPVLLAGR